jgi:NAD(P)-dependent dehydrogenase (short-subunit alcohol dehydrogenase family)
MNKRSSERVAMVTGASRGIGRCAALDLARRGFDVVITARTVHEGEGRGHASSVHDETGPVPIPGSLETTAAEIEALGRKALVVRMDVLDRVSVGMALATVIERWGHIDVLDNNAIYQGPATMDRLLDTPLDLAAKIVEGNYLNQLALVQQVLPLMVEQEPWDSAGTRGVIVNMTSATALMDPPGPVGEGGWGVAYAAAKAAFTRMAPIIHVEFRNQGIRAYNVDPGHIRTATMRARAGESPQAPATITNVSPEIPGAVIGWLASDDPEAVALAGQVIKAHRTAKEHQLVDGWP